MKIQPGVNRVWSGAPAANPTLEPAMKMRWTQRLIQQKKLTQITLDNGSKLLVRESPDYKLQSLYDKAGNWVKSKLRYYRGKQIIKTLNSDNKIDRQ